jgi:acyl carrier protein
MTNTEKQLLNILSEVLEINRNQLKAKREANIFKEFGVDSLLALEILARIEREFDIKIEDDEIPGLDNFNAILSLTNKKLKLKNKCLK